MSVESLSGQVSDQSEHPYADSIHMSLRQQPSSKVAASAISRIASTISDKATVRRKHIPIVGAIIGDLLRGLAITPSNACYRALSAGSFSGFHYSYRRFVSVRKGLEAAKYLRIVRGRQAFDGIPGAVSRFHATPKLISELRAAGITPSNFQQHFSTRTDIALVHKPIRRKTASSRPEGWKVEGKAMSVPNTPKVAKLAQEVHQINGFLRQQTFEGMAFDGLFRGFNQGDYPDFDWNKGGRLYAVGDGYQGLDKVEKRPLIRFNGHETVEVDIRASHLTIFHALMGAPLPGNGDPYDTGEIGRDGIKLFCAITLGAGKLPSRWSSTAGKDYRKAYDKQIARGKQPAPGTTGRLAQDYPFKTVRDIALRHIPLLKSVEGSGHTWADFQFLESQVLIQAMKSLIEEGVTTLPLHDSLICPRIYSENVSECLVRCFEDIVGVKCYIKIK